jgi:hypothetical protein
MGVKVTSQSVALTKCQHRQQVNMGGRYIKSIINSKRTTRGNGDTNETHANCINTVAAEAFDKVQGNGVKGKKI